MNKAFLKLSTFLMLIFSIASFAQGVKNQSQIIKNLKEGRYKAYGHDTEVGIKFIGKDKSLPLGHSKLVIELNPESYGDRKQRIYFRDNPAFPTTYVWKSYTGMEIVRKKLGYVLDKDNGKDRLVAVDNYVFLLSDWVDKDQYTVDMAIKLSDVETKKKTKTKKKKRGFGSFLKAVKSGLKNAQTGGFGKLNKLKKEVLQPYLDKAFDEQKVQYAKWIKSPKNRNFEKRNAALRKKILGAERSFVKRYNDSIYNSPKERRDRAIRRRIRNHTSASVVTIKNNSGRTIYIGTSGSRNKGLELLSGYSHTWDCKEDGYFQNKTVKGNTNSYQSTSSKAYSANSRCGGTLTLN